MTDELEDLQCPRSEVKIGVASQLVVRQHNCVQRDRKYSRGSAKSDWDVMMARAVRRGRSKLKACDGGSSDRCGKVSPISSCSSATGTSLRQTVEAVEMRLAMREKGHQPVAQQHAISSLSSWKARNERRFKVGVIDDQRARRPRPSFLRPARKAGQRAVRGISTRLTVKRWSSKVQKAQSIDLARLKNAKSNGSMHNLAHKLRRESIGGRLGQEAHHFGASILVSAKYKGVTVVLGAQVNNLPQLTLRFLSPARADLRRAREESQPLYMSFGIVVLQ